MSIARKGKNIKYISPQELESRKLKEQERCRLKFKPLKKVPDWINPKKGIPISQESKTKNAITHGAKPFLMKDNKGHTLWTGLIQSECAKKFNLSIGNISECLHGKRKQHKGFTFHYGEVNGNQ